MIKGIFFDMGGTLYSYRNLPELTQALLAEFAQRHELAHDAPSLLQHYVHGSRKADHHLADKDFYLFRDYFRLIYAEMLALAELHHLEHDFDWFADRQTELFCNGMILKENVHEVLEQLRAKVPYMSIVSNIDEEQFSPLLSRAELTKWLDHWTSSESAQSCKPHDRFFQVALEKSGLRPEQVLFVGDSLEQDIAGAAKAGMRTVLITEGDGPAPMHVGKATQAEPDYRIRDLAELVGIVEELVGPR